MTAPLLPALPAGDGRVAGMLVSEGLCPHCGGDLVPSRNGGHVDHYGWCHGCQLGWSLTGGVEPTVWFLDDLVPGGPIASDDV